MNKSKITYAHVPRDPLQVEVFLVEKPERGGAPYVAATSFSGCYRGGGSFPHTWPGPVRETAKRLWGQHEEELRHPIQVHPSASGARVAFRGTNIYLTEDQVNSLIVTLLRATQCPA